MITTKAMMPLVTARTMLHTKFCDGIPSDKSLWLNNKLKYKRSPMYIQESINAGLYDYYQLLHSNGTMMTYDALPQKFGMPLLSSLSCNSQYLLNGKHKTLL